MDESSAHIIAAQGGDAEAVRRLLESIQRQMRVTAALFLPTLRDVDDVVLALGPAVVATLPQATTTDPLPWARRLLRELISVRLKSLESDPVASHDPFMRLLVSSGLERLQTIPPDTDAATALRGRVQWMSKGATDLLSLRFANRQPLEPIASQRGLSVDDLCDAMQTASRQLDWTGDAHGGVLDPSDYRAIDGLVTGTGNESDLDILRVRLLDDMGLSLRTVRATRLHLLAAAWFAPEFNVPLPILARPASAVAARNPSNSAVTMRSAPARSPRAPAKRPSTRAPSSPTTTINKPALRESRQHAGLIVTLFGGTLVVGGLILILLRGGTTTPTTTSTDTSATTTESTLVVPPLVRPPEAAIPVAKALLPTGTPTAPLAAWSTRRVVDGYRGPLLRIRRSGDHLERDINATASGELDVAALIQFTSRAHAHVAVWYDQSGNLHHMRQDDRNKQPRIIRDGTLEIENSRPVIIFDRARFDHLTTPAGIPIGSLFALVKIVQSGDGAQGLIGSLTQNPDKMDAYYPIVDRDRNGTCEWWLGEPHGQHAIKTSIANGRLLLWHSTSDGSKHPTLALHLDGKEVGTTQTGADPLVPVGPTVIGCLYWDHHLADPFGGSLGELFVLPPGASRELQTTITEDLKKWWKTP